jgi:hypothetical protein
VVVMNVAVRRRILRRVGVVGSYLCHVRDPSRVDRCTSKTSARVPMNANYWGLRPRAGERSQHRGNPATRAGRAELRTSDPRPIRPSRYDASAMRDS